MLVLSSNVLFTCVQLPTSEVCEATLSAAEAARERLRDLEKLSQTLDLKNKFVCTFNGYYEEQSESESECALCGSLPSNSCAVGIVTCNGDDSDALNPQQTAAGATAFPLVTKHSFRQVFIKITRHTDTELDDIATRLRPQLSLFVRNLGHFVALHGAAFSFWYQRFLQGEDLQPDFSQEILGILQTLYREQRETRFVSVRSRGSECKDIGTQTDVQTSDLEPHYKTLVITAVQKRSQSRAGADLDTTTETDFTSAGAALQTAASSFNKVKPEQEIEEAATGEERAALEQAEEEELCRACVSRPRDRVLLPCSHLVLCSTCVERVSKCPVCRQDVMATLKVVR